MRRVDSHFHIWDLNQRPQDWMTPDLAAVIGGPYDISDWQAAANPAGVSHGIFVQTVGVPDETPEVLRIAAERPELIGVVGWVDVSSADPDVIGQAVDELRAGPGGDALVGTRVLAEYHPDPDWLDSREVHAIARALGERGLTLDLLTKPDQLPAAARLVASHPQTRFVLDHLSKPTMNSADKPSWAEGISAVAASANVACKLSGYLTFDAAEMTADRLRPYFDVLIGTFGPSRMLFGSDWPVDVLGGGYAKAVAVADGLLAGVGEEERARVWSGTALEWYPAAAARLEMSETDRSNSTKN